METVFVDKKGVSVSVDGGRLVIRTDQASRPSSIPIRAIKRLVVVSQCSITSQAIRKLNQSNISIVFIDSRSPEKSAQVVTSGYGNVERRLAQYRMVSCSRTRELTARKLIKRKITLQILTIRHLLRRLPQHRTQLSRTLKQMHSNRDRLAEDGLTIATLLGIEGAAAQSYFFGLSVCLAPSLHFSGRNRRPPRDPVNAILSLTYTLAHQEATRQLVHHSLDPMLGFLHSPNYGRPSLACDFVELLRGHIDAWVVDLFLTQTLKAEHFCLDKGACLLKKSARAQYFALYNQQKSHWQRRLRRYNRIMLKFLDSEHQV